MASIKEIAKLVIDEAKSGIAWIAVWKKSKSWHTSIFWPDSVGDSGVPTFDAADTMHIDAIKETDNNAIVVNSYYCNLGDPEEMTIDSLADVLRWQYEMNVGRNGAVELVEKLNTEYTETPLNESPSDNTCVDEQEAAGAHRTELEEAAERNGWYMTIKARGYKARLVGIQQLTDGTVAPIYRFPGGDSLIGSDEMLPYTEHTETPLNESPSDDTRANKQDEQQWRECSNQTRRTKQ